MPKSLSAPAFLRSEIIWASGPRATFGLADMTAARDRANGSLGHCFGTQSDPPSDTSTQLFRLAGRLSATQLGGQAAMASQSPRTAPPGTRSATPPRSRAPSPPVTQREWAACCRHRPVRRRPVARVCRRSSARRLTVGSRAPDLLVLRPYERPAGLPPTVGRPFAGAPSDGRRLTTAIARRAATS